ncbi:MAG: hypothetical protein M1831_001589 [Alyxoria varia]|nr:MAG: hypothetical protein M1831_001589 [Alyxoria varia]
MSSPPESPQEQQAMMQEMKYMLEMLPIMEPWMDRQHAAGIAFIVLAGFFVALRFLTRQFNDKSRFGWDDWMIIPALLAVISCSVSGIVLSNLMDKTIDLTRRGILMELNGPSSPSTSEAQFMQEMQSIQMEVGETQTASQKAGYAVAVAFPLATMFPKLSIALTYYLRIFTSLNHGARYISLGLLVFLTLNGIAFEIPSIAPCNPIHSYWAYPPQYENCIDRHKFGTWINLPHIVSDLVMLALPLPLVWRLKFPAAKKIALSFIFLSGGLHMDDDSMSPEAIKLSTLTTIFTMMEPTMYVIAACLPPILGLVSQKGPGWVSSASSRFARSTGYGSSQGSSQNPTGATSQASRSAMGGHSAMGRDTKLISAIDEDDEHRLGTPTMGWNEKQGIKEVTVSVKNDHWPR